VEPLHVEIVLQDTPVLVLPRPGINIIYFLTLPQKALEAIMLLHNVMPDVRHYSKELNVPIYRLLDYLQGVLNTNCNGTTASCGPIGVLLVRGSLFNHSDSANVRRRWDDPTEQMIFTATRDIRKGNELELDYLPGMIGFERAQGLKRYGL
jgi:hypothetical protein